MVDNNDEEFVLLSEESEVDSADPKPDPSVPLASSGTNSVGLRRLVQLASSLWSTWVLKETVKLLRLALPLFFYYVLRQAPFFTVLVFVGKFSTYRDLTAVALGSTFINVTGYSILIGLGTAVDTLCPQAYGYRNYKRVGVIFQRGVLILSLVCIPIAALWLNTESILLLLRQQPCVVGLAGQYLRVYILALPALLLYLMLQKYLQAQSLVWVFVLAGLLVNVAVVVSSAIFIVAAKMGVIGAALSISLSTYLAPLFLIVYIKWRKLHRQTWGGWSFESLTEWWQFLRLGIPGCLMVAFEWWSFEISAIVVGTIDETQLAINAVIIQYSTLLFMVALSVAVAVNIRVGNELGAGNYISAKRVAYIGLGIQVVIGFLIASMMLILRNYVARLFTSHQEVIEGTGDAMYGAFAAIFFDQIQGVLSGLMRATGMQLKAAVTNFVCYYVVGVPLGIVLALVVGLKTQGMWIGISVAAGLQCTIIFILLVTLNWKKQSEKAMKAAASKELAESVSTESVSTEEDSVSDGVHDSELVLKKFSLGEEEEEDNEHGPHPLASNGLGSSEDLVSYKDTEKLVYQDTARTRTLYSNTKCCKTKTSILISKSVFLLVGVAALLVGAVLAGTIRHHRTDDEQCSNSSLVFSSIATPLFPNPTRTSNHGDATPHLATSHPVLGTPYSLGTTTHVTVAISPTPT